MAQHPNSLANLTPGRKPGSKNKHSRHLHDLATEADNKRVYERIMKLVNSEDEDTAFKGLTLYLKTFIISAEKMTDVDIEEVVITSAAEQREVLMKLQEVIEKRLNKRGATDDNQNNTNG